MAEPPADSKPLKRTDEAALAAVLAYAGNHGGRTPTVRELADILGYSNHGAALRRLNRLVEAGALHREPNGRIALPVKSSTGPSLHVAEVLNPEEPGCKHKWLFAPEPGMKAFFVASSGSGMLAGSYALVTPCAKAAAGQFIIGMPKVVYAWNRKPCTGSIASKLTGRRTTAA